MKTIGSFLAIFILSSLQVTLASEIKMKNISFPGTTKPKFEKIGNDDFTQHFSVSASYKVEVELEQDIPRNTAHNVRAYAIVKNEKVSLGDARIGRAKSSGHVFVSFYIFPSSAKHFGPCSISIVVDADDEISEDDESLQSNEWKFPATIHRPGENF